MYWRALSSAREFRTGYNILHCSQRDHRQDFTSLFFSPFSSYKSLTLSSLSSPATRWLFSPIHPNSSFLEQRVITCDTMPAPIKFLTKGTRIIFFYRPQDLIAANHRNRMPGRTSWLPGGPERARCHQVLTTSRGLCFPAV